VSGAQGALQEGLDLFLGEAAFAQHKGRKSTIRLKGLRRPSAGTCALAERLAPSTETLLRRGGPAENALTADAVTNLAPPLS